MSDAILGKYGLLGKYGWILSNNEKNDTVIQKDDEMDVFKNDDEATEFVVDSYFKLLNACKEAHSSLRTFRNVPKNEQEFITHDENVLLELAKVIKNSEKYLEKE